MDGHKILEDFFCACSEGISTTVYPVGNEAKTDYEDRTITLNARDPREQK